MKKNWVTLLVITLVITTLASTYITYRVINQEKKENSESTINTYKKSSDADTADAIKTNSTEELFLTQLESITNTKLASIINDQNFLTWHAKNKDKITVPKILSKKEKGNIIAYSLGTNNSDSCGGFNLEPCVNIIFDNENSKLIYTNLNKGVDEFDGQLVAFNKDFVVFEDGFGEGSTCGGGSMTTSMAIKIDGSGKIVYKQANVETTCLQCLSNPEQEEYCVNDKYETKASIFYKDQSGKEIASTPELESIFSK
jgi:uncharacterized protein YpmB